MKRSEIGAILLSAFLCMSFANASAAHLSAGTQPTDNLHERFVNPPASARPWVYYFVLNGNLTKKGITADLEAMAEAGIGGLLFMEVDCGVPSGKTEYGGEEWMSLISHLLKEAKRLGLEVNMNNDAGWNGSGGPWISPEMSTKKVVWSETVADGASDNIVLPQPSALHGYYEDIAVLAFPMPDVDFRLDMIEVKSDVNALINRNFEPLAASFPHAPEGSVISKDSIVDLTTSMDSDGTLHWQIPGGRWLFMRFGCTTVGKENHPAPLPGRGLECDKLRVDAAELHFSHLMQQIIDRNKVLAGAGLPLSAVHIDSWENGAQNWTQNMRDEFRHRRGYDILPFLPVLSGRVVGGIAISERFLWDLRQTVADMLVENYAGTFKRLAGDNGLRLTIEAYGEPADDMTYAFYADEPMAEFWSIGKYEGDFSCTEMASAGHVYGKNIIGAESFTSWDAEKWSSHPGNMKDLADWAFCEGINRLVFHRYAAQAYGNITPGVCMGPYGTHYERTQTWWAQTSAWHTYLTRCQEMLRQGTFVADLLYLSPEGNPRCFNTPANAMKAPHIRGGYGFDGCSAHAVLNGMSVRDGRIHLPSGMSYAALVLPEVETMTPALIQRIKALADSGGRIIGAPIRPVSSPSLADMGEGDSIVSLTSAALWESPNFTVATDAAEVLKSAGLAPDFDSGIPLRWIHRHSQDADIYFIANPFPEKIITDATFRISGRQPHLWNPADGTTSLPGERIDSNGLTTLRLSLAPYESTFVVFRDTPVADPVVSVSLGETMLWEPSEEEYMVPAVAKAVYGIPGDSARSVYVTEQVRKLLCKGQPLFNVTDMAASVGDPAFGSVKTLVIDYSLNGYDRHIEASDGEIVNLMMSCKIPVDFRLEALPDGHMSLSATEPGQYLIKRQSGKQHYVELAAACDTIPIEGAWEVDFPCQAGGPGKVTFQTLSDWTESDNFDIRHFSGTAVYRKSFVMPRISSDRKIELDLGTVNVTAKVILNGREIGICWKSPYRIDVTDFLKPGNNELVIEVANLWINRQIGDEKLPPDSRRNADGTLMEWPEWLMAGKSSPTGRISFATWNLFSKSDTLVPSGLSGPVSLVVSESVTF